MNTLINGDCIEEMKKIPDSSVDMILTDPPYNISKKNNFGTMERYNKYKGMDFGEWDKKFNQLEWIKIAIPKLKQGSNIIVFNSWQNLKLISDELENNGCSVKRILVVKKTNPMPVNRDRLFVNSFEFIIYATKGKKWVFNRRYDNYETGFFECKNNGETKHPTEKQVVTIQELVTVLTNEEQIVLDPFMGSGTTGVAAKNLNRNFIGIEKDAGYFEIAKRRINAEASQGKLEL